jgi:glycosyltransferase involved in cell wall biosynthesis
MKLSVVVPFHNERNSVEPVLEAFSRFAPNYDFELICVDDASSDDTQALFSAALAAGKYPFARVLPITAEEHKGYGYAIMRGVRDAKNDVIAWTHSDLQTDPADVFRALDIFIKQNDEKVLVKGRRVERELGDALFSAGMACIASVVLGQFFFEINAQPKLFHRSLLPYLKDAPDDFSLDLYLLSRAKKQKFRIVSIDVLFHKRQYGESNWAYSFASKRRTIMRTIKYIFRLRAK